MDNDLSAGAMDEIMELIYSGQKIAACKGYMELRDREFDDMTSLLEAKRFIEALTEELKAKYPDRFTKSQSAGCAAACLVWVVPVGGAVWWTIQGA